MHLEEDMPLFLLGVYFFGCSEVGNDQQTNPDAEHGIGDVECWPVMRADVHIDKVPYASGIECPVVQVADDPAGHTAQRKQHQPGMDFSRKKDVNHNHQCYSRDSDQKKCLTAKDTERRTVIFTHDELHKTIDQ